MTFESDFPVPNRRICQSFSRLSACAQYLQGSNRVHAAAGKVHAPLAAAAAAAFLVMVVVETAIALRVAITNTVLITTPDNDKSRRKAAYICSSRDSLRGSPRTFRGKLKWPLDRHIQVARKLAPLVRFRANWLLVRPYIPPSFSSVNFIRRRRVLCTNWPIG